MRRVGVVSVVVMSFVACVGDETVGTVSSEKSDASTPSDAGVLGEAGVDARVDAGAELPKAKLVFLTFQKQSASSLKQPSERCSEELRLRGRGGAGFAWAQSPDGQSPTSRLSGSYNGPWVLPSGKIVFPTKDAITTSGADNPINETLFGQIVTTNDSAWTGLKNDGTPVSGENCQKWDDKTGTAKGTKIGISGPGWASNVDVPCGGTNYLICFEQ